MTPACFYPMIIFDSLISDFNAELANINSWLISNKLVLNTNKTSYMIFFQTDQLIMIQ